MTSFNRNYLPKASTPNTTTLEVRASTYEFVAGYRVQDDTIQSVATSEIGRLIIFMVEVRKLRLRKVK